MDRLVYGLIVFSLMLIAVFFLYRKEIKLSYILKNSLIYYLKIILISVAATLMISYINPDNMGNLIIYFLMIVCVPFVIAGNQQAKSQQIMFEKIIGFCSSMAMLLKQNENVYNALEKCLDEEKGYLQQDIEEVMNALPQPKQQLEKVLKKVERRYPYTIIRELNIIILQMHYEGMNDRQHIISVFENDVELLQNDIRENQSKRKLLRVQYIGLSCGCMGTLWLLVNQLNASIGLCDNKLIGNIMLFYYVAVLVMLFFVDRYFTTHLSKE